MAKPYFVHSNVQSMVNKFIFILLFIGSGLIAQSPLIYVGTFSQRGSEGIYVYEFAEDQLTLKQTLQVQESPSFLALHPKGNFLYAANRSGVDPGNPKHGSVSAFQIAADGKLTLLNEVTSGGQGACHVALSPQGNVLAVSNYSAGSVAWYMVLRSGKIGDLINYVQHQGKSVNIDRQTGPHAHSAIPSKDGQFWFVSDLGMDAVLTYSLEDGQFVEKSRFRSVPGSGPRHFKMGKNGRVAYSIEELSSTIQVLKVNYAGKLKATKRYSTLVDVDTEASYCADVHVHPSGDFIVGSNRGANTLASFKIKPNGNLNFDQQQTCGGDWPRNFGFSPDGQYLLAANERSDELVIYQVDAAGNFKEINREKIPAPACVLWLDR